MQREQPTKTTKMTTTPLSTYLVKRKNDFFLLWHFLTRRSFFFWNFLKCIRKKTNIEYIKWQCNVTLQCQQWNKK
jgi:hypothetical protein